MCKCNDESVDHLFIHCPVAMDLWSMVLGLFGVSSVMPQLVVGLLACWQGWFGCHQNGHIWIIIPHCVFGRKEMVNVLKIMRDPYQTSSFFFLQLYWIGCLLCKTNHSLLFLLFLFIVIFLLDLLTLVHSLCTRVSIFLISIKLFSYQKMSHQTHVMVFLFGGSRVRS